MVAKKRNVKPVINFEQSSESLHVCSKRRKPANEDRKRDRGPSHHARFSLRFERQDLELLVA